MIVSKKLEKAPGKTVVSPSAKALQYSLFKVYRAS